METDEIQGLTELTDLEVVRQDAVRTPASGFPFLVMKAVATPPAAPESEAEPTQKESEMTDPQTPEAPEATPEAPADNGAVTKEAVAEMIAAAVAEVSKAADERNKALADELAVLKATPIPAGIVLTAPADATKTREQANAVAKATYHRRQLELPLDRELEQFHKDELAKAEALIATV